MVHVIWKDLRKVRVESETAYGSDILSLIVGKYLWGTIQENIVMDDFLRTQFIHHAEVEPHITL